MAHYKPHARVARRTSRRIDEVDGVPTTHTPAGWVHASTVTDDPHAAPPPPFTAKTDVPAAVAVPAMCAVLLTATVLALAAVLGGNTRAVLTGVGCIAGLALWGLVLTIPAIVRSRR